VIGPSPAIIFVDPDTGEDCPVEEFEVFEESFDEGAMIEEGGSSSAVG
jgi:hypothetical protein